MALDESPYLRDDDSSRYLDGWFRTGDRGEFDAHGNLRLLGRADSLVVVRGSKVDLTQVESALRAHPLVTEAIVVHDKAIEAYVATESDALTPHDVAAWCAERLADFKQPRRVRVLRALPRTSSGKLVRNPRRLADARRSLVWKGGRVEQVVLLDESGAGIGVADKASVHHASTPLHLAFSSYLFDAAGRLLLTRRALHKKTWPGVWTNSCCGHPAPDEPMIPAVSRRLADELGLEGVTLDLVLPAFRYRAVMENGIIENEMCPVFRGLVTGDPTPNPDEVDSFEWVPWAEFAPAVLAGARPVSPWCALQVAELWELGPDPLAWPTGPTSGLPAAAHLS